MNWKVLAGVLVADFVTAAAHWIEDTYLPHSDAPGLLGEISRDNDIHHFIPYSVTVGSWWDTCRVTVQLLAGVAVVVLAVAPRWASRHRVFLGSFAAAAVAATMSHRFQHERDCTRPAPVTWLQRLGVLCSREQHAVHHRETTCRYSVLLSFTNFLYDAVGIWRFFEWVLSLVGLRPSARKPGVQDYAALHDDWLVRNMARDCPEPLTRKRLDMYYRRLAKAHRRGLL